MQTVLSFLAKATSQSKQMKNSTHFSSLILFFGSDEVDLCTILTSCQSSNPISVKTKKPNMGEKDDDEKANTFSSVV